MTPSDLPVIDCDIHPVPKAQRELAKYLPQEWRDHIEIFGPSTRQPFRGSSNYPKPTPALSRRDSWPPCGGPPGSNLDFMRTQHLEANNIEIGILQPLFPSAKDQRNPDFGIALSRALNDWQVREWTERESRLRASIVVPCEDATASVREIDERALQKDFAQIFMTVRARDPLGDRRYWPIYEAAVRHDLPIGIHTGGVTGGPVGAGGWPSYYVEEHQSHTAATAAMLASFVFNGVFEQFPALRIVCVEASFAWVPPFVWRMDRQWERHRAEVPHVKSPPSHYISRNVWLTTQPIDEPPRPRDLLDVMEWVGWNRLLFATDYPHWDFDDPKVAVKAALTNDQKRLLFNENARKVYRFD
jgi:uncharacterized protein